MNWLVENIEVMLSAMVPLTVIVVLASILIKAQAHKVFDPVVEQ